MVDPDAIFTGDKPAIRLADFIREEMDVVIAEWIDFAGSHVPSGADMTHLALQDHIVEILNSIADDLQQPQTNEEQVRKSKGDANRLLNQKRSAAEIHAKLRLNDGFNIDQMVSEYRALRASVVKQWIGGRRPPIETVVDDLTRFNEAIDQAIAESVAEYTTLLDQSRNLFLGILGHDLRNPIGAVSMAAERLQRLSAPDSKQMTLASQIVETSQRGLQILNDLLDITRSSFGTEIPIVRAPMDMAQLASQLVVEMRSLAKGRSIDISLTGNTQGAWDKARMGQVFSNLLSNAIQYSPPDSAISMSLAETQDGVLLEVANKGAPIDADTFPKLFDALTRGRPSPGDEQSPGHLGLGLYITKKIVLAHNGEVTCSSDKKGTIFSVRLPRQ